eukprot:gnl/MRDRNA2_/MRDRNA2_29955_c0_seq2.p1 gnl/MRDRNA2_/MRDRNA2_29955_c0~~gnl/MRDRNA2_/MRDRNA2_29955_c0_seq2.p1  ORF type:complete len:1353 (+),score=368.91 gnl/MRDRNA2_/MRDRNA2_29955_c0_seq2:332-4060(+)
MNSSRAMPIYSQQYIDKYSGLESNLPAHIFHLAALAYKELCDTSESQVIFLLGRSGSGKSTAAKHILMLLAGSACADDNLEKTIPELHSLLRPFVSARLQKVENTKIPAQSQWPSTRAMVEVGLSFDEDQFISKVNAKVDLLELSRVSQPRNGRNFDIFYELAVSEWANSRPCKAMVGAVSKKEDAGLKETLNAMKAFGIDPAPIFEMLGGIMLLSELKPVEKGKTIEFQPAEVFEEIADVFAVDPDKLKAALQEASDKDTDIAEAVIHALMEHMYDCIVRYIVGIANQKLVGEDAKDHKIISSITIMSSAPQGDSCNDQNNSFEDFCFNWMTELLEEKKLCLLCHGNPELRKHVKYPSVGVAHNLLKTITGHMIPTLAKQSETFRGNPLPDDDEVYPAAKTLGALADNKDGFEFVDETDGLVEVVVDHSFGGNFVYSLDGEFYNRASGRELPKSVVDVLDEFDDAEFEKVLVSGAPGKTGRGINAALSVGKRFAQATAAPQRPVPWVVVCLAPNRVESPYSFERKFVLDQVHRQAISTTLLLTSPKIPGSIAYKEVFTAKEFRHNHEWFVKACGMQPESDVEAVKLIMERVGKNEVFISGGLVHTVASTELEALLCRAEKGEGSNKNEVEGDLKAKAEGEANEAEAQEEEHTHKKKRHQAVRKHSAEEEKIHEASKQAEAEVAAEEAKRKAAEEDKRKEMAKQAEEKAQAEAEACRKAAEEDDRRKAAEEEKRREAAKQAEADEKAKADAEAKRKEAEEEKAKAEAEVRRKAAEEEAKRKEAEDEKRREAAKQAEAEEKAKVEAEGRRKAAEEEAKAKAVEEEKRREAAKKAEAEEKAKTEAEAEARRKAAEDAQAAGNTSWFGGMFASDPVAETKTEEVKSSPDPPKPPSENVRLSQDENARPIILQDGLQDGKPQENARLIQDGLQEAVDTKSDLEQASAGSVHDIDFDTASVAGNDSEEGGFNWFMGLGGCAPNIQYSPKSEADSEEWLSFGSASEEDGASKFGSLESSLHMSARQYEADRDMELDSTLLPEHLQHPVTACQVHKTHPCQKTRPFQLPVGYCDGPGSNKPLSYGPFNPEQNTHYHVHRAAWSPSKEDTKQAGPWSLEPEDKQHFTPVRLQTRQKAPPAFRRVKSLRASANKFQRKLDELAAEREAGNNAQFEHEQSVTAAAEARLNSLRDTAAKLQKRLDSKPLGMASDAAFLQASQKFSLPMASSNALKSTSMKYLRGYHEVSANLK